MSRISSVKREETSSSLSVSIRSFGGVVYGGDADSMLLNLLKMDNSPISLDPSFDLTQILIYLVIAAISFMIGKNFDTVKEKVKSGADSVRGKGGFKGSAYK